MNPEDEETIRNLGRALCLTHDYKRAMDYYESALKQNAKRVDLLLDLAKLYILIKNYQRAEELLKPEIFLDDF